MIYTLLGYFGMNPVMEGGKVMALQDFYRINDCSKDWYSQSSANQVSQRVEYTPMSLSSDLSAILLLYSACGSHQLSFHFLIHLFSYSVQKKFIKGRACVQHCSKCLLNTHELVIEYNGQMESRAVGAKQAFLLGTYLSFKKETKVSPFWRNVKLITKRQFVWNVRQNSLTGLPSHIL